MKHRLFLITALFCCALAAGALCSSCRTGMVALIDLDDNLRMAGSGFDLSGTVTDEDGNPLDGVAMRAEYSRVNTATFRSENKSEKPVEVDSEFHFKQKAGLNLTFISGRTDTIRNVFTLSPPGWTASRKNTS